MHDSLGEGLKKRIERTVFDEIKMSESLF